MKASRAGILFATLTVLSIAAAARAADRVTMKAVRQVEPFPLAAVRLLPGPFLHAQELDRRYLLSLDPDRLLHNFCINAGLPSKAEPLGGWEAPNCELRGHFVGHYLSACALMYAATGDAKLKERGDYIVARLAECQAKMQDGYLSAFPESFIDRVEACKPVWAPWYTLHKIYAGLLDMHEYCGNQQALQVARAAADWVQGRMDKLSDEQMQKMLGNEHGGMNDLLAELAAVTGEAKYLKLAQRFNHRAVLDPLAKRQDKLTGLHANTQFPKVLGAARQYELTGDASLRTVAEFFWEVVTRDRSYVTGGNSDGEHFTPLGELSKHLSPTTTETCNTYNMRKITRRVFCWNPKAAYADYDECALLNHILGSQDHDTGMLLYYVPLKSGEKTFGGPLDAFWCCTGTGVENHAKYGDSIYFHNDTTLYVNLFMASQLSWPEKGLTLRQETSYPEEETTRLFFTCDKPVSLAIRVRYPAWVTDGIELKVNGQPQATDAKPGSYITINRTWSSGDRLELKMPMRLRAAPMPDNDRRIAFLYGPVVLCGELASKTRMPMLVGDRVRILAAIKPVAGKPLEFTGAADVFRSPTTDHEQPTHLIAFYRKCQGPYTVYWDIANEAELQKARKAAQAALEREKRLAARTTDTVAVGDLGAERAHGLHPKRSNAGEFNGRLWRDAAPGGSFSYKVKAIPDAPLMLLATYWGSDGGNREFAITVDGKKIATERLANKHPGEFYDVEYDIPVELTAGKRQVVVGFAGLPGQMAGGLFGLRVLKK